MNENSGHVKMDFAMDPIRKSVQKRKIFMEVNIAQLVSYQDHPFAPYEGQRFSDMVESIRANGIHEPIIVQPCADDKYEILSGHNRVRAAKEVGIETVPAVVNIGLNENEALLIVTETNLIQRSFTDLKHSERAIALTMHYEAIKKKSGYRSDLISDINGLTCAPAGHRLRTRDKLGALHGLGKTTIARYLRINKLIPTLKNRLDHGKIGMRVAEALSYLRDSEQEIIESFLADGKRISEAHAKSLKDESVCRELDEASIELILTPKTNAGNAKPIKLSGQFLSQYFNKNQSTEEVERVIAEALSNYFTHMNDNG